MIQQSHIIYSFNLDIYPGHVLDIYLDKTIIQKNTFTPVFIAALFTIAKTWKQPKCPSTGEWTDEWSKKI